MVAETPYVDGYGRLVLDDGDTLVLDVLNVEVRLTLRGFQVTLLDDLGNPQMAGPPWSVVGGKGDTVALAFADMLDAYTLNLRLPTANDLRPVPAPPEEEGP